MNNSSMSISQFHKNLSASINLMAGNTALAFKELSELDSEFLLNTRASIKKLLQSHRSRRLTTVQRQALITKVELIKATLNSRYNVDSTQTSLGQILGQS